MTPQPDAARRKSDEDSAVMVQRASTVISARSCDDSSQVKSVQHPSKHHRRRTRRKQRTSRSAGTRQFRAARETARSRRSSPSTSFYKQSTKGGMQSQDSLPQVVAQPQPKRGATVKITHGVWFVCEDRQSEFYHDGTTGQTFASTRTQKYT